MTKKVSKQDGIILLKFARENILREFGEKNEDLESLSSQASQLILNENRGTFVSLHKKGELRGCIGNIDPVKTVLNGVMENAVYAAFNDSRFNPLSYDELRNTTIEISILTSPEKLDYKDFNDLIAKLKPGIDGVIIKKNHQRATFLPQVWQQLQDPKEFLEHLCIKAGLSPGQWKSKKIEVHTYQVQSFEEQPRADLGFYPGSTHNES